MMAKPAQVEYKEGIFVGYRHFESANIKTAYPFGYGLSYTSFEYSKLKVNKTTTGYTIQCIVKNTGDIAGKDVAQLYISAPQTGLVKPLRELKGFQKTKLLKPGETQTLSLSHIIFSGFVNYADF